MVLATAKMSVAPAESATFPSPPPRRLPSGKKSIFQLGSGQRVISSTLAEYLCQPLITFLRETREQNISGGEKLVDCSADITISRIDSHQKPDWVNDTWIQLLTTLQLEITQVLGTVVTTNSKVENAATVGNSTLRSTSNGVPEHRPDGKKESVAQDSKTTSSKTFEVAARDNVCNTSSSRTMAALIPNSDVHNATTGGHSSANSLLCERPTRSTESRNSKHSVEKLEGPPDTLVGGRPLPAKTSALAAFVQPRAFVIPVQSFTELSEQETSRTVMARVLGDKAQAWFSAHILAIKRFSGCYFLVYACLVFFTHRIPLSLKEFEYSVEIFGHLWMILYLSSMTNWSMTAASAVGFDFLFMSGEICMFVASMVCMQYARYLYATAAEEAEVTAEAYPLNSFYMSCGIWTSVGLTFLTSILFCDGSSLKDRGTLRNIYLAVFTLLSIFLALVYFQIWRVPDAWLTAYLDIFHGHLYYAQPSQAISLATALANDTNATSTKNCICVDIGEEWANTYSVKLFDFWLNRGFTVCLFGLGICLSSFLYPEDFVFIRSRMKIVLHPDNSTKSIKAPKQTICGASKFLRRR